MNSKNARVFSIVLAIAAAVFFAGLIMWQERAGERPPPSSDINKGSNRTDFSGEEIFSTSYSRHVYETGFPLPDVCWEYLTGPGRLEKLEEDYGFQYPGDLDFEEHSYIVSFGCKVLECWSDRIVNNEYVLSVLYDAEYQGKNLFLYQLPKVNIYPLDWPSYVTKEGKQVQLATTPTNCDKSFLDGYQFYVEFPMEEIFSAAYTGDLSNPDVYFEFVCEKEQLEALAANYSFSYPNDLDLDLYSYLISFGYKVVGCRSDKIEGGEYALNITEVSEFVGRQVFFYQFPKFIQGK